MCCQIFFLCKTFFNDNNNNNNNNNNSYYYYCFTGSLCYMKFPTLCHDPFFFLVGLWLKILVVISHGGAHFLFLRVRRVDKMFNIHNWNHIKML